jgi:hypothetical protein
MKTLSNTEHSAHLNLRRCPRCNSWINPIPRRLVDLLLNLFMPVERYCCRSFRCDWEGNLPVKYWLPEEKPDSNTANS